MNVQLLVLDVDGTLFQPQQGSGHGSVGSSIWHDLAHALGPAAVAEDKIMHGNWERGKYKSYLDWIKDAVAMHQRCNLSAETFESVLSSTVYQPGVVQTLSQIDTSAYEVVLISGSFRELAARVQRDFRVHHAFAACEYLFNKRGRIESYNLLPCDFEGKLDFIRLMIREYGLASDDWIFVGNGLNDVAIAKTAPVSVGFRPEPALKEVVTHIIEDFQNLLPILEARSAARAPRTW